MAVLGDGGGQTIQRRKLCEIIEARMGEIFSLIREEVKRSGHAGMLPAGAVLTGGGARLAGADAWRATTLEMPVRVGSPQGVGGLMDQIGNPAFSTPIGLLLWGAHQLGEEPIGYGSGQRHEPASRASATGSGASSPAELAVQTGFVPRFFAAIASAGSVDIARTGPRRTRRLWITPCPDVEKRPTPSYGAR